MKHLFFLLGILSVAFSATAQEDSVAFHNQVWKTQEIKKGIIWKQAHFDNLFGGEQEVNLIEIDLNKHHKKLKLAGVSRSTKPTSTFAQENKAVVAINGGFFNTKTGGAVDYIMIDGEVINHSRNNHPRANAYLAFDRKSIQIVPDSLSAAIADNILLAGPLLILDGKIIDIDKNKFNDNKHPRTAVALRGRSLIFITIDGRNKRSHGVSLPELSQILSWHGSDAAMNLDGGGSTAMYVKGQPDRGIVNYPSDNKQFDHQGERPVANIIYIKN